jgi:hypothetical protein
MKGFVFLYGSEILLRFVQTGAFKALEQAHDITYIALESSVLMKDGGVEKSLGASLGRVEWIPFHEERFRKWVELFDISCIRFRDLSSSFEIRYRETARQLPLNAKRLERQARAEVYDRHRIAVENDMGLHPDLLKLTIAQRPDFFVLPSALLDYVTDDALQLANAFGIPTLMLVAGWDSLSSKGLIYHHPSMTGVWGEQTRRHAVEIQKLNAGDVHLIGAPQYEKFHNDPATTKSKLREMYGLPLGKPVLLFAGSFRTFDETELLMRVETAINKGLLPDLHILYRPHPWRTARQMEDNYFDYDWKHVTMDSDVIGIYQAEKNKGVESFPDDFLFRLTHLTQLYQAVDAVISPMSTVLLEALMFDLPTMAVAFGDGKHAWSADKGSKMAHFDEFLQLPEVIVCRDDSRFFTDLTTLLAALNSRSNGHFGKQLEYFLYRDSTSYSDRVLKLVSLMLSRQPSGIPYDSMSFVPGKTFAVGRARKMILKSMRMAWKALNQIASFVVKILSRNRFEK